MVEPAPPAFYARQGTAISDWWTLLHPPYAMWHLSYVVLGAAIAPSRDWAALGFSVLAFFLAVGLAAHALDELDGRPLKTGIGSSTLWAVAALALVGAVALGIIGAFFWDGHNWALAAALPLGMLLVVGYNLELFDGALHTDHVFAWGWGGFPVVVGYVAQSPRQSPTLLLAATAATVAAVGISYAQRCLSAPARQLRRHTALVTGSLITVDGASIRLERTVLLTPLENALRALSLAVPMVAVTVLLAGS
jgi:hypothetical protein